MPPALDGIRIVDFGTITAGANATQVLADLGADVIKVESASRPDTFRAWQSNPPAAETRGAGDDPWNRAPTLNMVNRNKRGVCIDVKQPRGRELVYHLAQVSDAVAENYRHGVMDRLGVGYQDLSAVNPGIVMISIGSQGATGPEADYGSYGSTLDALSGLMSMTGYADSPRPYWSSEEINYPDQVASMFSAGLLMAAMRFRNRTGRGLNIDLSQRELVTTLVGEQVLRYTSGHGTPELMGNLRPGLAPNDFYRCDGEDAWVAITCTSDAEWRTLCSAIDRPALGTDPRFAAEADRRANQAAMRQELETWTRHHTKREAMDLLQHAGVRAGAVLTGADMLQDPHLRARGYFQVVEHPSAGPQTMRVAPYHLSETPPTIRTPAPKLGEHTEAVLRSVLGTSDAELQELAALHVTDNVPLQFQRVCEPHARYVRVMQIRADFHTHSIGEAVFGPSVEGLIASHIDTAAEVGLDCLAVSDHNDLRPGLMAREYAARRGLPLLVLPAMELTTAERVHLLAIGLEEPIEAWRPLDATIARIRDVGGISILPHPFFAHLRAKSDVDAIEQYNSRYGDFNLDAATVARVADSDSHSAEDLRQSQYCTILDVVGVSWSDVADAVRAGRTIPCTARDTFTPRGPAGSPDPHHVRNANL